MVVEDADRAVAVAHRGEERLLGADGDALDAAGVQPRGDPIDVLGSLCVLQQVLRVQRRRCDAEKGWWAPVPCLSLCVCVCTKGTMEGRLTTKMSFWSVETACDWRRSWGGGGTEALRHMGL